MERIYCSECGFWLCFDKQKCMHCGAPVSRSYALSDEDYIAAVKRFDPVFNEPPDVQRAHMKKVVDGVLKTIKEDPEYPAAKKYYDEKAAAEEREFKKLCEDFQKAHKSRFNPPKP